MAELSGAQWCSRFPTSCEVSALVMPFRDKVTKFVAALRAGNADVSIHATLRPKQRAYLMHYSYLIAKQQCTPGAVPPLNGVEIQWVHSNTAASIAAAAQMVAEYGIVYEPALTSRHIQGLAIDMDISWTGDLAIKSAKGGNIAIQSAPRTGMNTALWTLAAAYGVHKLAADPPHWSSDGH